VDQREAAMTQRQHSKWFIYPFFLLHMAMFGGSGFLMAYADDGPPVLFMFAHGGIAISAYVVFYLNIFGRDAVQVMFTNAALGLFGIYAQIGWILEYFGKDIGNYPWYRHLTPFLYYVLYTFLLWQLVVDLTRSRDNPSGRSAWKWATWWFRSACTAGCG
jgi:hypothetical protein